MHSLLPLARSRYERYTFFGVSPLSRCQRCTPFCLSPVSLCESYTPFCLSPVVLRPSFRPALLATFDFDCEHTHEAVFLPSQVTLRSSCSMLFSTLHRAFRESLAGATAAPNARNTGTTSVVFKSRLPPSSARHSSIQPKHSLVSFSLSIARAEKAGVWDTRSAKLLELE